MTFLEHEQLTKKEGEIVVSKFVAERFLGILENKGFTLHRIGFNVESSTKDSDGTEHTTVKPVVIEKVDKFDDDPGVYLLKDEHGLLDYLIEFENISNRDGIDYFVGITQTPSLEGREDLGEWRNEVLSTRARPAGLRDTRPGLTLPPRMAIESAGSGRFRVELFGEDFHLEDLYELLTGHTS